ncbi:hypothetical protein [Halorussus litoreus]|uniref:hypothetical protein n=1 Tax=Halorussus litoreus TaxID=1710536 RepID=UPI000E256234|nr:hypothetical protein [Halorussus litoreus]
MTFPYESIPDSAVFAPHHFHYAVLAALVVAAVVWDNFPRREPVTVVSGLLASEFAFSLMWPWYPVVGAALSLLGLAVATLSVTHAVAVLTVNRLGCDWPRPYWAIFPLKAVVVLALLLVAWDDLANHAFGVATPLDSIWNEHIYPHMA